jgi:hypothetical protein
MMTTSEYWVIGSNSGEYVAYYNRTGSVMHFTNDKSEAMKLDAMSTMASVLDEIVSVARKVYRRQFKSIYVCE